MRISDWSSDVCSSDLRQRVVRRKGRINVRCNQHRLRTGEITDIGRRLAREHRIVAQAPLLHTLDFGVPIRALDEPHRQAPPGRRTEGIRSEAHTSELQSLMRISYAVFCLKKKTDHQQYLLTFGPSDLTDNRA